MPNALDLKNLSIHYKTKTDIKIAVDQLSFNVHEGEFFGLLGPNGAGKTSIITGVTGLVPVHSGSISVFGLDPCTLDAKRLVGYVPQELVSYGFFNVNEVLNFHSGYFGIRNNQKRIDELLERLELTDVKYRLVAQLSGGMKRRLLIAKALVHSPRILLLDEPSAGVDVELRTILWDFMVELNRSGMTILLTTHYLEEAQRLCKRVAILNQGKLLAFDETGALISSMSDRIVTISLNRDHTQLIRANPEKGIFEVTTEGNQIRLVASSQLSLNWILQYLQIPLDQISDLKMDKGDLETAFLKLVKMGRLAK